MASVQEASGNDSVTSERRPSFAMSPVAEGAVEGWWANNVASNLQKAIASENVSSPSDSDNLSRQTKEIARHIANGIPNEFIAALVKEAKSLISIVEKSCLDNVEKDDEEGMDDGGANSTEQQMSKIVGRKIPQETSKWIAREIYSRLLAAGEDISSTEEDEDDDHDLPVDIWKSARGSFDVRKEEVLAKKLEETGFGHKPFSASASVPPSIEAPTPRSNDAGGAAKGVPTEELRQRSAAFKKFKQVLGSGTGFRVIKHNHNGGCKTRVLKYSVQKNKLFWESSKMLGGEQISCSRIVKVHREVTIVYIWYMTGGRHGSVKKMVGFETQREADAQILELALLYLKDHGSNANRT